MTSYANEQVLEAVAFLKQHFSVTPAVGIVMGSGLGELVEEMQHPTRIRYADIPHFPVSTVKGHAGEVVVGILSGKHIFALSGRVHYYEGHDMGTVVFPIKVMASFGVRCVVVTNAAGGINKNFLPGDIVVITDHMDLMRKIPLTSSGGLPCSKSVYDARCRHQAACAAAEIGVTLKTGVYAALSGPSYETPAEIRALRIMGADMVGMSTVPEATEAHRLGMKVLGISFISNPAAGLSQTPLSHQEVIETSARHLATVKKFIKQIIKNLDHLQKS
ncbi:MAG: purine-nucleoside phosphorylase [Deltaproteobacteria bacterium]|jgi:purine-nucleoside phosphorylase|nr:purine-nucleoside phosphorylase [Deltaproteobacteria bacterium]